MASQVTHLLIGFGPDTSVSRTRAESDIGVDEADVPDGVPLLVVLGAEDGWSTTR